MWSVLFVVSAGQAIFFLVLLLLSKRYRSPASAYLSFLLSLFLITNIDYYFLASEQYKMFPWLFGLSNGLMLLMGPALYLYTKSLLHGERFHWKLLVHAVPYLVFLGISFPIFTLPFSEKIFFIDLFVAGNLPLRQVDYAIFIVQLIHLSIYLALVARTFKLSGKESAPRHEAWVRSLLIFLIGYGLLVLALVAAVFSMGKFSLTANYTYSVACSMLLYFTTGFALLNPDVSFASKKKGRKPLDNIEAGLYWEKLLSLMDKDKPFVKPDLKLQDVAQLVGLTPHQLSQLVNERFGKSFSDFLNHYRVEEFKLRVGQPEYDQFTLIGLGLEIGFNSKTSFNNTFKKFTGLTPSEYKRTIR